MMKQREGHMSAPNLGPVSTLLLTIIEERADTKTTPNNVSSDVCTPPDNKTPQNRESNTKLPVERWPGFLTVRDDGSDYAPPEFRSGLRPAGRWGSPARRTIRRALFVALTIVHVVRGQT